MAQRTRDAEARDRPVHDGAAHTDDGVQPDQRDGRRRRVEVRGRQHVCRHGVRVDLEADGERRLRRQRLHELVQPQGVGPQLLVAERVVAEDALPVVDRARPADRLGAIVIAAARDQHENSAE
jgi:hypothetical protein